MSWFGRVVSAAAYSVCRQAAASDEPGLAPPYNDVAGFVEMQIGRMPMPQGWGVRMLCLLFDVAAFFRCGALFHRLRHEERLARLAAWRRSPFFFCRQFVRLHESLAVFCLYARLESCAPWERG